MTDIERLAAAIEKLAEAIEKQKQPLAAQPTYIPYPVPQPVYTLYPYYPNYPVPYYQGPYVNPPVFVEPIWCQGIGVCTSEDSPNAAFCSQSGNSVQQ